MGQVVTNGVQGNEINALSETIEKLNVEGATGSWNLRNPGRVKKGDRRRTGEVSGGFGIY